MKVLRTSPLALPFLTLCVVVPAASTVPATPSSRFEPPYQFRSEQFAARLAATQDAAERGRILVERWVLIQRAVEYCNVALDSPFSRASLGWAMPEVSRPQVVKGDLEEVVDIVRDTLEIRGDCVADLKTAAGAIHVLGDLRGTLNTSEMAEIIVAGDVAEGATIKAENITSIFVGGDLRGVIEAASSLTVWAHGDMTGTIRTGNPIAWIHVMGDYRGDILPIDDAALLSLDVRGFATSASIKKIAAHFYTEFQASVGLSDDKPGIHGGPGPMRAMARWVIHEQQDD